MRQTTRADREAAAARRAAAQKASAQTVTGQAGHLSVVRAAAAVFPSGMRPGGAPDYFNVGNYANSPLPVLDATGAVVSGTGIRKFVDSLPGLGAPGCATPVACNANNLGQFIPIASAIIGSPGVPADGDYYEIGLSDYSQRMHSDLPATKLRGYRDLNGSGLAAGNHYLGPVIIAQRNRPVRIKFTNELGTGAAGNLFIPVDTTAMGAGMGPNGVDMYTENRATLHLHGGHTPWISDGTPHQWIVPAGDSTPYKKGVSQQNVPDMPIPAPGSGSATFFWSNDQSSRLMFYHDHAYGTTRLNVYAGEAAGYLLWDQAEEDLISGGNVTGINPGGVSVLPDLGGVYHYGVPLIIQDKTFLPSQAPPAAGQKFSTAQPDWGTATGGQLAAQDPTWDTTKWSSAVGSLWYPHVYSPNQNPADEGGANAFGRWDYGPWFWPPLTTAAGLQHGEVTGDGTNGCAVGVRCPGILNPSLTPEAFMDTAVVNGTAYPYMTVQRKAYRFRILNAANDRAFHLALYYADPANPTEMKMVPAVATAGFPADWPTDGRDGGVPDPTTAGPDIIQIGNESGFLPAPVVFHSTPIGYEYDRRSITVLNVATHGLLLGPAERADVIVDFSQVPDGSTLILYNDSPAPVPAFDTRLDYYTGSPDQTATGGTPPTMPGYGPNTRTLMQFRVAVGGPVASPFNLVALQTALPRAFGFDQGQPIVPETANAGVAADTYSRIQDTTVSANGVTYPLQPKAIQELFELNYGRMNATLGVELPLTNFNKQTTIPLGYVDPLTESVKNGQPQFWKITHNGVDTHFVHFHLADIQVVNRIGWDGMVKPPDANEVGWKETIRMNPLEDIVVALKPTVAGNLPATWPVQPNGSRLPDSVRVLDPTMPEGAPLSLVDPATGNFVPTPNDMTNFGWEYVWHCHILGHEENDMMRPLNFDPTPVTNAPTIASVLPVSGPAAGNTLITIAGTNFPPDGTAQVWVGGVQATSVVVNPARTQITARTPANAAGLLADVVVTTPGNAPAPEMQGLTATPGAGTTTSSLAFAYLAPPTITSVAPSAGPTAGGTTVTITGTNFVPGATTVTFGGVAAPSVAVTSTTSLNARTPAGAAGPATVVVTNGAGAATLPSGFTYGGSPTVTGVTPATGPTTGGTLVVITGTNFVNGATTVTVGGAAVSGLTVTSATSMTALTPPGAVGAAAVAATTPGGTGTLASAFTYDAPPTTTGISPSSGPLAGGTLVSITTSGTSFGAGTTVTIGGVSATSVSVLSATSLTAITPPGAAAGAAAVVVTTPPSPGILLAGTAFTYLAAPTVTNLTPATGPTGGGTMVTITGTRFVAGNTQVTFAGAPATLVSVTSATSLTAIAPAGTVGAAPVVVTTPGGAATSGTAFNYYSGAGVASITPASGPLAGGTTVTITGTNFVAGSTTVTIGGAAATAVTVTSATSLTAVTPAGTPGVAAVVVTTPAGSVTLAATGFTYLALPVVTAISPTSGPPAGGTFLTITGQNFAFGTTAVTIGGAAATLVSVASATTLTAVTPAGTAANAPVVVTTGAGSSSGAVATFHYYGPVSASPSALRFVAEVGFAGGLLSVTPAQPITVSFGAATSAWTAASDVAWLQLTNGAGSGAGQFTAQIVNGNSLVPGSLNGTITVTAPNAPNGSVSIPVTLTVVLPHQVGSPFGQVDSPAQNATGVAGSIGVTGWALDDVGVAGVKIYRNCLAFENQANCQIVGGTNVVFMGDAVFVAGARPDVEGIFPTLPQANRAGWGYLLLTNLLPHVPNQQPYGGQGPITIYAFASDVDGHVSLLGRIWQVPGTSDGDHVPTSLTLANDTLAKPFGGIDTPSQGGTVSGSYANFGWVLTPDGGSGIQIPTDGSTITVLLDGVAAGTVTYNQCRGNVGSPVPAGVYCNDDVANIFGNATQQPPLTTRTTNPSKYRNLDAGRGAIGSFVIDTTTLANGMHQIGWVVTDSAGRAEGVGSRYFTVMNAAGDVAPVAAADTASSPAGAPSTAGVPGGQPSGSARPRRAGLQPGAIAVRTGFDIASRFEPLAAGGDRVRRVRVPELGRLEVALDGVESGYLIANGTRQDLPAGSHLDPASGVFSWAPGPGYLGTYHLVFVRGGEEIPVAVTIGSAGARR